MEFDDKFYKSLEDRLWANKQLAEIRKGINSSITVDYFLEKRGLIKQIADIYKQDAVFIENRVNYNMAFKFLIKNQIFFSIKYDEMIIHAWNFYIEKYNSCKSMSESIIQDIIYFPLVSDILENEQFSNPEFSKRDGRSLIITASLLYADEFIRQFNDFESQKDTEK